MIRRNQIFLDMTALNDYCQLIEKPIRSISGDKAEPGFHMNWDFFSKVKIFQ